MSRTYKIYMIAGESSGDFIGNRILRTFSKIEDFNYEVKGVGGAQMQEYGINSLFDISEINLMGFAEILPHIKRLRSLIQKTADDILSFAPDIVITIDSPGFTMRVAKLLRGVPGFEAKLMHIVAPSVWAYKPGRAKSYIETYDHLLAILPFELQYFQNSKLDTHFIGHPIMEQDFYEDKDLAKEKLGYKKDDPRMIIGMTPGSRKSEIERHAPIFMDAAKILRKKNPDVDFEILFIAATDDQEKMIKDALKGKTDLPYKITKQKLAGYAACNFILAKSGTNAIEITASGTPVIVCYKTSLLSYLIIRAMAKIRYVNLCNILASDEIIPELIQGRCNAKRIAKYADEFVKKPHKGRRQVREARQTLEAMGFDGVFGLPSHNAARIIISTIYEH